MIRTPASFKALREGVGYSQAELADVLGVSERSVKRWEQTATDHLAPDEAWELLEDTKAKQDSTVESTLGLVDVMTSTGRSHPVELPYWKSAEHYAQWMDGGSWLVANATARKVAEGLDARGVEYGFVYRGSDDSGIFIATEV